MATKRDLARERLERLFKLGAGPHEVARSLRETQAKLILARAKAGNLPKKPEQELKFVTSLPVKAMAVVREWFRDNLKFGEDDDFLEAIERARHTGDQDGKDARAAWRTILAAFAQADCPPEVTAFLTGNDDSVVAPVPPVAKAAPSGIEITDEDAALCLDIANGVPWAGPARLVPAVVSGIVSALAGDATQAAACRDALASQPHSIARTFSEIISVLESRNRLASKKPLTIRKSTTLTLTRVDNPQACPFLGTVKQILPSGLAFIRHDVLLHGEDFVELTVDQAMQLFPSSGDAMAYPEELPSPCRKGEEGIWVAEHKSAERTQYVVTEHVARVYDVVAIPHPSNDPDKVRQWLQGAHVRGDTYQLFHLADGMVVKLPGDHADPAKFNFDNPLDAYWGLEAIQLRTGRLVVAKRLPAASKYDCAPASTWVRRLVKDRAEAAAFPEFSRTQLAALVSFAKDHVDGSTFQSYLRAKAALEDTVSTKELLEGAMHELLSLPEVSKGVEGAKEAILIGYRAQHASLQREIAALERSKKDLVRDHEKQRQATLDEVDRLKRATRLQESELERRIKETFAKATEDGISTLAQAALVRAIISTAGRPSPGADPGTGHKVASSPRPADLPAKLRAEAGAVFQTTREIHKAIRRRAASGGLSEMMLASVIASGRASPVVGLLGNRVREVVGAVADVLADGVTCEVSVTGDMFGVGDLLKAPALVRTDVQAWSTTLGEFLAYQQAAGNASVIELRGANRSPPESFLPELLDLCADASPRGAVSWLGTDGIPRHAQVVVPVVFVLSFVTGKSTFPLHGPLARSVPFLQVDKDWPDGDEQDRSLPGTTNRVDLGIWLSIGQKEKDEGRASQYLPSSLETMLGRAMVALALDETQADAISYLSLQAGRRPVVEVQAHINDGAPAFAAYARELTEGNAGQMLRQAIQIGPGE